MGEGRIENGGCFRVVCICVAGTGTVHFKH